MGVEKRSTRVEVGRSKTSMICVLQDKKGMLDTMRSYHQTCAYWTCAYWIKSRDVTLPTKVHLVKAIVCMDVRIVYKVMYGCESWTIKKAEC